MIPNLPLLVLLIDFKIPRRSALFRIGLRKKKNLFVIRATLPSAHTCLGRGKSMEDTCDVFLPNMFKLNLIKPLDQTSRV